MPFCKTNNLPIVFNNKNSSIFDIIKFIIKFLLFFDTSCLFSNDKIQWGGSSNNTIKEEEIPSNSLAREPIGTFYSQPGEELYSQYGQEMEAQSMGMGDEETQEDKLLKETNYSIISREIANGIKAGKNYGMAFLLIIVNFFFNASLYPSVPFFGVLAFCYASLKWFFMKFKRF
jgi:hypothetical protein